MSETTLVDTPLGRLWQNGGNETIQDSKVPDASKFRVGAPYVAGQSGGGGAYSFDVLNAFGRARTEVAVFTGGYNGTQGEVGLSIWNGQEPFGDANQKKVVEFYGDHVEFKVPISAPNLSGGGSTHSIIQSGNGRVLLAAQDDGNLVLYVDGVPVRALFGLPPDQTW